jgi:hypothetical protein
VVPDYRWAEARRSRLLARLNETGFAVT